MCIRYHNIPKVCWFSMLYNLDQYSCSCLLPAAQFMSSNGWFAILIKIVPCGSLQSQQIINVDMPLDGLYLNVMCKYNPSRGKLQMKAFRYDYQMSPNRITHSTQASPAQTVWTELKLVEWEQFTDDHGCGDVTTTINLYQTIFFKLSYWMDICGISNCFLKI